MRSNRKVTVGLVLIDALCAVIWTFLAIEDIIDGKEMTILGLHIFCAVVWCLATVLNFIRYRSEKDTEE